MNIPKIYKKREHIRNLGYTEKRYVYVKRINKKLFLYKDEKTGFNECFNLYDLGLISEQEEPKKHLHKPEDVIF